VFRRCRHVDADTDANDLACYSLLPYSNRIGGGQFMLGERAIDVPCNRTGEPLPIHGDGWLADWTIAASDAENLTLTLDRRDGKPYAYRATQTYALDGSTLVITLEVENTGREAMPFGLGVHPFLVRDADTQLSAAAAGLWLSDEDWLPVRHVPVPPAWQFGVAYPLPRSLVNHAFTGWSGHATVVWREAPPVADDVVEYRVLHSLHADVERLFLLRTRRSPDQRDEPAGRCRRQRHDDARARPAACALVQLRGRAHWIARDGGWARGEARVARAGNRSGPIADAARLAPRE
jgi:aldose 1-epimerase